MFFIETVRRLPPVAQIDVDLCAAKASMIKLYRDRYNSTESLMHNAQCILAHWSVTLKHNVVYKHFCELVVFLLTLPVTSASCERVHSKVDLVKSAVRTSMGYDRLHGWFIFHIIEEIHPDGCAQNVFSGQQVCSSQQKIATISHANNWLEMIYWCHVKWDVELYSQCVMCLSFIQFIEMFVHHTVLPNGL